MIAGPDLARLYAAAWANPATRPLLEDLIEVGGFMDRSTGERGEGRRDVALHIVGMVMVGGGTVDLKLRSGHDGSSSLPAGQ